MSNIIEIGSAKAMPGEIVEGNIFIEKLAGGSDLTIPVTYRLNNLLIINEFQSIKKQIESRNFSGANRMIYNLFRFQKSKVYFSKTVLC